MGVALPDAEPSAGGDGRSRDCAIHLGERAGSGQDVQCYTSVLIIVLLGEKND